jgi:hypothetical protein
MITKFQLFESINININIPQEILNKLINSLSIIVYKGTKRDIQKHKNYKSIRITDIDGHYNDNKLKFKEMTNNYLFKIKMNNKDYIEAKYTHKSDLKSILENSIYIEINGIPLYDMEYDNFTIDSFIDKIRIEYEKYLQTKNWKIK